MAGLKAVWLAVVLGVGFLIAPACEAADYRSKALLLVDQAYTLSRLGRHSEALQAMQSAMEIDPESWRGYINIAQTLTKSGHAKEAFAYLSQAYVRASNHSEVWWRLAAGYHDNGDDQHAAAMFREFIKRFPEDSNRAYAYSTLGYMAANNHQAKEASEYYKKAVSLSPDNPQVWLKAGQLLEFCNCQLESEASYYYGEYLKRFPEDEGKSEAQAHLSYLRDRARVGAQASEKGIVSGREGLDGFIVGFQGRQLSVKILGLVKVGLQSLPTSYVQALMDDGYKVVIGATLDQVLPDIVAQHPRGWRSDATWHNANGTFYAPKKWIVIGEKFFDIYQHRMMEDVELDKTVCHEFGHAYDHYLGGYAEAQKFSDDFSEFSQSKKFREAYEADLKVLPGKYKVRLAYFLQPDVAGREELFAQMLPCVYLGVSRPGSPDELFATCFPTVLKVMSASLDPNHLRYIDLRDSHVHDYHSQ